MSYTPNGMGYTITTAKTARAKFFMELVDSEDKKDCINFINQYNDFYDADITWHSYRTTPLNWACYRGYKTVVDPNKNFWNKILLGSIPFGVDELIKHGADVNKSEPGGWSPLMNACASGDQYIVIDLINRGVDVNQKTNIGYTAMSLACLKSRYNIAKILIDRDVDFVDVIDKPQLVQHIRDR